MVRASNRFAWTAIFLCGVLGSGVLSGKAVAHPATGILVNAKGEVYFIHTGRGVGRIDSDGKLEYVHEVHGGGHFMCWDSEGAYSTQFRRLFEKLTPEGEKPCLLYASGGAPFLVHSDGNLYYGSGYPDGDDKEPGFLTLTRLSSDGSRTLFAPDLKNKLEELQEGVMGLAEGPDGTLFVSCPNAILKVTTEGTVSTFVHPVVIPDSEDDVTKGADARAFHSPYLRGLTVAKDGTVYAAVNGCRCVVKITPEGKVENILKSEKPWSPTGVAVHGKDLFVLEYSHPEDPALWAPRVRKLSANGEVKILATHGKAEK